MSRGQTDSAQWFPAKRPRRRPAGAARDWQGKAALCKPANCYAMDVEVIQRLLQVQPAVIRRELNSLDSRIWIPDTDIAFRMCNIVDDRGEELIVGYKDDHGFYEKKVIKRSDCQATSITHFCDDICDLSELNDASILHTLHSRYINGLIHTYSGLFCVVLNPWKNVPLYSKEMMQFFKEQSKVQQIMPPHIYSVAQLAFDGILNGGSNQSILITGESGAGKTENTKKIIEYLIWSAEHATGSSALPNQQLHLELVSAGTALEAFTNARTVHNYNSSRVGKFIRIDFDATGKLQAAQIECYLLEKSRVINQNEGDRNFHIFYQLLSSAFPKDLRESLGLRADAASYKILNQGGNTVDPCINDREHGLETQAALHRLGFSDKEKMYIYEIAAICILMGEVKFCERKGLDISYIDGESEIEAACRLLKVKSGILVDALTQPCIRVGDKVIRKSQNLKKTLFSVAALIKILYERMFKWIVNRCNAAIDKRNALEESVHTRYIGVLDMAGFEIMKTNSFEQFCINYTNEKLQQFFNHFLFVREQSEYLEEKLEWNPIDYTDELLITIEMIEKPLGLLALLQEECLVPNGSDSSLLEKFIQNLSQTYVFARSKLSSRNTSIAHFTVTHYAGSIPYNIEGWVEKNRDSVDQNILEVLAQSENEFVRDLFPPIAQEMTRSRKGNLSSATVSYIYKEQLNNLLQTLQSTSAHFVRCIVPNHNRQPDQIHGPLVLHQLRCNGVLEGVRICRKGYPNRIPFLEFYTRYKLLAGYTFHPSTTQENGMVEELCQAAQIPSDRYQLGVTKVFCRAGLLSELESRRKDHITVMVSSIQAHIRWYYEQRRLQSKYDEWDAVCTIQSNVRTFSRVATWDWHRLYGLVRPLIPMERDKQRLVELTNENESLYEKCSLMMDEIDEAREAIEKAERESRKMEEERQGMERKLAETREELTANEDVMNMMEKRFEEQHQKVMKLHNCVRETEKVMKSLESEKQDLAHQLLKMKEKLDREVTLRVHFEEENEHYQTTVNDMETKLEVMRHNSESLHAKIQKFEDQAAEIEHRRVKQCDLIKELQQTIEDLNKRTGELDITVRNERNLRRKLESDNDSLLDDVHRLNERLSETQSKLDQMKDNMRKKDTAIRNLEKAVQEKTEHMDSCIAELKKIHKASQADMQNTNEDLRKKCQKLEAENRQLKQRLDSAVFDRESSVESDYGRGSRLSLSRQYSISSTSSLSSVRTIGRRRETEPDVYRASRSPLSWSRRDTEPDMRSSTMSLSWKRDNDDLRPDWTPLSKSPSQMQLMDRDKQIAQLERSLQTSGTDNQLLRREIEVYKESLSEAEREKEALVRQNKSLLYDFEKLKKTLSKEEDKVQTLEQKLKKCLSDVGMWKQKFEDGLVESKNDIIFERKKMKDRMEKLIHEHELRNNHYSTKDKTRDKLQAELADTQANLDRALAQIAHMEKLSRSQISITESWESQNKASAMEMDGMRKENASLKVQVRRQARQIELLTQQSEIDDCVNKLESNVDRLHKVPEEP
uniref:Myosin motor domain-containing protein n=1 Tax=Steinernema glaseri TaxID=37863 RepID=A0A1I7YZA2_9BILA